MDTTDMPTTTELNAELDPDIDSRATDPLPWETSPAPAPAETVRIALQVRVRPDTPLLCYVFKTTEPMWAGQLAADLFFDREHGPVGLSFAAGYDDPAVVLAAIDNLATALGTLRAQVEAAA
jgi:hypothetical protein